MISTIDEQSLDNDVSDIQGTCIAEDENAPTTIRYEITSYGAVYPADSLVKR